MTIVELASTLLVAAFAAMFCVVGMMGVVLSREASAKGQPGVLLMVVAGGMVAVSFLVLSLAL